jgi:transposase
MSKHRVAVLKVVSTQLSITAAAAEHGMSRQHLHRLLRRYRDGGLEALEPRSRRPRTNPGRTPDQVRERIIALRAELMGRGLDAGPVTIAWHLGREGLAIPSTSTIRRILHAAGLVTPEPRKRTPKAQAAGTRAAGHFRLRYDLTDRAGRLTLRRAGRLHHLKVGAAHARRRVLAIASARGATVVALETGELLSSHRIEPEKGYWRNTRRDPGRWPGSRATG